MVRVVIDTNVLISALVGHGKPKRLVSRVLEEHVLVTSMEMLAELSDVISRGKFSQVKRSQATSFISKLAVEADIVRPKRYVRIIKEDPDDDVVLVTAHEGKAEYIISGDKHLLDLRAYKGTKIMTASEMLEVLG